MEQNTIEKWLIEELDTDSNWERKFAESENILDRLANEALENCSISNNYIGINRMNQKNFEDEILRLPVEKRAELAQKLLLSLEAPSEDEIAEDWMVEALRRAREIDEGTVQPIPAEEVRRKAQALLR
jgi:putative addiction module component (TIGR02574 family)